MRPFLQCFGKNEISVAVKMMMIVFMVTHNHLLVTPARQSSETGVVA
jgi:hypothetical protein